MLFLLHRQAERSLLLRIHRSIFFVSRGRSHRNRRALPAKGKLLLCPRRGLEKTGNSRLESEQGLKNVPALLHIKSGAISKTYTNWADIRTTLADAMEANE